VCVIGGGVSGLYAAHLLKASNVGFDILESSNRLGGRIKTISYGKDYAD
jgi:protoporphyrinogen oxidase